MLSRRRGGATGLACCIVADDPSLPGADAGEPTRTRAIRRWGDPCFHRVDEEVEEGFILGGVLIPRDEVLEVIDVGPDEVCPRRVATLRLPSPSPASGPGARPAMNAPARDAAVPPCQSPPPTSPDAPGPPRDN